MIFIELNAFKQHPKQITRNKQQLRKKYFEIQLFRMYVAYLYFCVA